MNNSTRQKRGKGIIIIIISRQFCTAPDTSSICKKGLTGLSVLLALYIVLLSYSRALEYSVSVLSLDSL